MARAVSIGVHPKLHGISPASTPCPLPHCAGFPLDMHSANIPSECEDCVPECDIETCDLGVESSQCTDRCLVVSCEDPCFDVCTTSCMSWSDSCKTPCQGFEDLPCEAPRQGTDLSASLPNQCVLQHQACNAIQHLDWTNVSLSRELDALICACATQSQPHSFDSNTCDPKVLTVDKSHSHSRHQFSHPPRSSIDFPGSHSPASALFSPISGSTRSSPDPSSSLTSDTQPNQRDALQRHPRDSESYQPHVSDKLLCLWAECRQSFCTSQELISHVNATHLHLPIAPEILPLPTSSLQTSYSSALQSHTENAVPTTFSCMWKDCHVYPTQSHVPGPSTGNVTDAALGLLASHLLQDHLGVSVPQLISSGHTFLLHEPSSRPQPLACSPLNDFAQPLAQQHFCKWQHCAASTAPLSSSAALTAHITEVHVGGGKNRYHCMWEGCNRQGTAGFSSKQKILRHIQSHTGYRPFQCNICDQFFSEAATLQQHMRRHTKERPYVCDFAGCKKAFAIAGALTIHKRTHSGKKPFKCQHCGRSFSESSNLSKHVRTHTGDRPYPCSYPSCEKRFARPDQVARHMNVHKKGLPQGTTATTEDLNKAVDIQDMEIEQ